MLLPPLYRLLQRELGQVSAEMVTCDWNLGCLTGHFQFLQCAEDKNESLQIQKQVVVFIEPGRNCLDCILDRRRCTVMGRGEASDALRGDMAD